MSPIRAAYLKLAVNLKCSSHYQMMNLFVGSFEDDTSSNYFDFHINEEHTYTSLGRTATFEGYMNCPTTGSVVGVRFNETTNPPTLTHLGRVHHLTYHLMKHFPIQGPIVAVKETEARVL